MYSAWIGTRDSVLHLITVEPFRISGAKDLASLGRATTWLNSAPLTADGVRGKVVLVDFWTYRRGTVRHALVNPSDAPKAPDRTA